MVRIYKERLGTDGETVTLHGNIRRILSVQNQSPFGPCVWYEVDDRANEKDVVIMSVGTGWDLPSEFDIMDYIGTVQDDFGYVWHYYATPFPNDTLYTDLGDIFSSLFEGAVN